jgi:Gas vesicle synthesis protein GvpL/GvpF
VTATDETVYVYGVWPASAQPRISSRGVGGAKVGTIGHAGIEALTSPMPGAALGAADVRAHWRVLEEAFERAPVLPIRFGTVLESEAAVRERLLEPDAERLTEALQELTGLVQLNVKGVYDERLLLADIVRESWQIAELRGSLKHRNSEADRLRLGQLVSSEIARRRDDDTAIALSGLERLAAAVRADEVAYPQAFGLAFLVDQRDRDAFDVAVSATQEQFGARLEIRYVGPLPPFSFVEDALSCGSAGWG